MFRALCIYFQTTYILLRYIYGSLDTSLIQYYFGKDVLNFINDEKLIYYKIKIIVGIKKYMVKANKAEGKLLRSISEDLSQQYILLLLDSCNHEPVEGKNKIMMDLFFISRNIKPLYNLLDFEASNYIPYSEKIAYDLETLSQLGLIQVKPRAGKRIRYSITGKGIDILEKLDLVYNKSLIGDMKQFFTGLSFDEELAFIYYSAPEMIDKDLVQRKLLDKHGKIALSLYKKEKVSLGKAVEMSGLDYKDFFDLLDKNDIQVGLH